VKSCSESQTSKQGVKAETTTGIIQEGEKTGSGHLYCAGRARIKHLRVGGEGIRIGKREKGTKAISWKNGKGKIKLTGKEAGKNKGGRIDKDKSSCWRKRGLQKQPTGRKDGKKAIDRQKTEEEQVLFERRPAYPTGLHFIYLPQRN